MDDKEKATEIATARDIFARLKDTELNDEAIDLKVVLEPTDTRDQKLDKLAAAVVAAKDAEATAAKAAPAAKPPTKKEVKATEDRRARDEAIRRVNADFIKALPQQIRSGGVFERTKDDIEGSDDLPVPDGDFRVSGSDFVQQFKDGKWTGAYRAHANPKADVTWLEIPDMEGSPTAAPSPANADIG